MDHDVLIIGSGLAGMSAALRLAPTHKVCLVTKHELLVGASSWAQGGIAAVLDGADSLEDHVRDTHVAGAGLCHDDAVRFVVERGRQSVEWLVDQGVPFTRDEDNQAELHLTREGGHSHRRIAHAADATGRAVQTTLVERVKSHPNIEVFEGHVAIDLITGRKLDVDPWDRNRVRGAYVLDRRSGVVKTIGARVHDRRRRAARARSISTRRIPTRRPGDGVAMAWRAGSRSRTWSSSSSTRPASSTRTPSRSSSRSRCAAKAGS
jgi:L-aspartate oxidase